MALAPTEIGSGRTRVTALLTNTGTVLLRSVRVEVDSPAAVTPTVGTTDISELKPGQSVFTSIEVWAGLAARGTIVVRATATSDAGVAAAVGTVAVAPLPSPVTLALSGNNRLTDTSVAELLAVLTNTSAETVHVALQGEAGHHEVTLAPANERESGGAGPVTVKVPAGAAVVVTVEVDARDPLRRGKVAVVVTGRVTSARGTLTSDLVATKELEVQHTVLDLLPEPIGIGGAVLVPGVLAVWAWLKVVQWDRRRLGVEVPSAAKELWDNKLLLLLAAAISVAVAFVNQRAGGPDVIDAPELVDIAIVAMQAGLAGVFVAAIWVSIHRLRVPMINAESTPAKVLRAAAKTSRDLERPVYSIDDGKKGLFVHRDRGLIVLTPPIGYLKPGAVDTAIARTPPDLVAVAKAARVKEFDGDFVDGAHIASPMAVPRPARVSGVEAIISYFDDSEDEATPVVAVGEDPDDG